MLTPSVVSGSRVLGARTEGRLYGRDEPLCALVRSFSRISQGQSEVLLIPGTAGVGKTSTVRTMRSSVVARNGFFLEGKFNQYQRDIPYCALREALARLASELTVDPRQLRRVWIPRLRNAVGTFGQLIVDLVPEFAPILGDLPPVEEISPGEARHRFAAVLRSLLSVVARAEHPVVFVLDDWQWADTSSLELLKLLELESTLRYLLLIAPYRNDEVESGGPLHRTVEELRRGGVTVRTIELQELRVEDVRAWAEDVLPSKVASLDRLSALIHRKTGGNPFFVQATCTFLRESELRSTETGVADGEHLVVEGALPDNVVELYRERISRLDAASRDLFARAACLGNRFDIESLATISQRTVEECRCTLSAHDELVGSMGDAHDPLREQFGFVHDCIQQAAHSLIPPRDLPAVHLAIGRLLLARFGLENLDARVYELAGHLNHARPLIRDSAEVLRAIELNAAAARCARSSTAWCAALHYHRSAAGFLAVEGVREDLWTERHELAFSFFLDWAESEFVVGDRARARALVDEVLARAQTPTEIAATFNLVIVQDTLTARYTEAIAAGVRALGALGITLPTEDYEAARDAEIALVRRHLAGRSAESLATMPPMSHSGARLAAKILIAMGPPCYRSHQRLWGVIVPKVVNLTLEHGSIPQIGYSYPAFAGLVCWVDGDFALAKKFSELAAHLMKQDVVSPSDRSVYALMMGSSVRHWFGHLRRGTDDYAEARESGLRSGNLQYASYAYGHDMYCRFYQGEPLGDLIRETKSALEFGQGRHNQWADSLLEGGLRVFSLLATRGDDGDDAPGDARYLRALEAHHDIQVCCIYKIMKTFALMVIGQLERAASLSEEVEVILDAVGTQGLVLWPEHVFSRLLIATAREPISDELRRVEIPRILEQLRRWAVQCPENFEHKFELAAAEVARIEDRPAEALVRYEQAIEAARKQGFHQWEGLAYERAGRFWRAGNGELAQTYLGHAYRCFERWGAGAKLAAMEAECLHAVTERLPPSIDPNGSAEALVRSRLLRRHVQTLTAHATQAAAVQMSGRLEKQAEELASATESLRTEVAERKIVQEALEHKEAELVKARRAAESAARLRARFLDIAAHELRTPVTAFSLLLELTHRQLEEQGRPVEKATVTRLRGQATRLSQLVVDLLDVSRLERGMVNLRREPTDMVELVSECLEEARLRAPDRRFSFIQPDGSTDVAVDRTRIHQVISNLLDNAIKYAPGPSPVEVRLERADRDRVRVSVRDFGPGIGKELEQELFSPFSRGTSDDCGRAGGLGLGLYICRSIVELHGGSIWVSSNEGAGCTFSFEVTTT